MVWYLNVLRAYSWKTVTSTVLILLILLAVAIAQLCMGTTFEWKNIEPIDQPDLMSRLMYSALVFVSLGVILYWLRFYKLLSSIFGSDRRVYRQTKRVVWIGLMLVMYFIIVPTIVDLLNVAVSFAYNVALLTMYLSPLIFVVIMGALTTVIAVTYPIKLRVESRKGRVR